MKILVTDSTYKHSLAAVRRLASSGHQVQTFGHRLGMSHYSKFSSKKHTATHEDLEKQLLTIIKEEKIDFILPVGAVMNLIVAGSSKIKSQVKTMLPELPNIEVALDKKRTSSIASKLGIAIPETYYPKRFEELEDLNLSDYKRYVIKSTNEISKLNTLIFTKKDIEQKQNVILKYFIDDSPMIQEKIDGFGFGFFAIYENGMCKNWMTHKRLLEYPSTGGPSLLAESGRNVELGAKGMKILNHLKWNGPAMVEFKQCKQTGTMFFLEINPKLWGSLDLCIRSGFDVPGDLVKLSNKEKVDDLLNNFQKVKYIWPIQEKKLFCNLFIFLSLKIRSRSEIIVSNISLRDPIPNLIEFLYVKGKAALKILKHSALGRLLHNLRSNGTNLGLRKFCSEVFGLPMLTPISLNENISFGPAPKKLGRKLLQIKGITLFIDLRAEMIKLKRQDKNTIFFGIQEYLPPDLERINSLVRLIDHHIGKGEKIYINCREGVGRAPLVVIAYLMFKDHDLDQAMELVKLKRPLVKLNNAQLSFLKAFKDQLRM